MFRSRFTTLHLARYTSRIALTVAALGLALTTATTVVPPVTAHAAPNPDYWVTFMSAKYGTGFDHHHVTALFQMGAIDGAGTVKATTTRTFYKTSTHAFSRKEQTIDNIKLPTVSGYPRPFQVACKPLPDEVCGTISVILMAPAGQTDTEYSNNAAWVDFYAP